MAPIIIAINHFGKGSGSQLFKKYSIMRLTEITVISVEIAIMKRSFLVTVFLVIANIPPKKRCLRIDD